MKNLALLALLALLGAGCTKTASPSLASPDIRMTRPSSGSVVSDAEIQLEGTANLPTIFVDGTAHPVTNGHFSIPVRLHDGLNTFLLMSGNGYTTSTVPLNVTLSTSTR